MNSPTDIYTKGSRYIWSTLCSVRLQGSTLSSIQLCTNNTDGPSGKYLRLHKYYNNHLLIWNCHNKRLIFQRRFSHRCTQWHRTSIRLQEQTE